MNQGKPKNKRSLSRHYLKIFSEDIPLLDLRAPVEFNQGAFPQAKNLPLLIDKEREEIGKCYKKRGQESAIILGKQLVSGTVRESRMAGWKQFIQENSNGYLYCFRGGLRSQVVQQWLAATGIDYPIIEGGYKAMRQFLIAQIESLSDALNFIVIGGRTGTRKTDLIVASDNAIDLEGRANHRGSSFGRRVGGQPTIINFENSVAIDLLKLNVHHSTILLEDEGVTIGRCSVPEPLRHQIKTSPLYLVEASVEERVENILRDYVLTLSDEYLAEDVELGFEHYRLAMFSSLERIKKRLGGERFTRLYQLMNVAFNATEIAKNSDRHREWIKLLIEEYYDPMYDFQLTKKQHRIASVGSWDEIFQQVNEISKA